MQTPELDINDVKCWLEMQEKRLREFEWMLKGNSSWKEGFWVSMGMNYFIPTAKREAAK